MNRIERPKTLVEIATSAIRDMIVDGRLALGERISECKVAETLGISTTPVREAFSRLAHHGQVEIAPQRGTFVFTLKPGELDDICDLRVALESAALPKAFERSRQQLATELAAIAAEMEEAIEAGQTTRQLVLDTAFHSAIMAASQNAYLVDAYALIATKLAALRRRLGADRHHTQKSLLEHHAIAAAVARNDLAEAGRVLCSQIGRRDGSYWEKLDDRELLEAR